MRFIIFGSAPISDTLLRFMKACFNCPIIQGYGQTETTSHATQTWLFDPEIGHVGSPIPSCMVKLVDVPAMGYLVSDVDSQGKSTPRGEICFKGPNCFKGYFANPELTKETIDDEGWVHSGDIGLLMDKGRLKVIDRKKNMFKMQ